MSENSRNHLAQEALEYAEWTRRSVLGALSAAGAGLGAMGMTSSAHAEEAPQPSGGKKIKVGIPLTYGPFNQPWRRGCWQIVKTVMDLGCEPVCLRGEPTKQSEQNVERALLDRGIDALCMGIFSLESETAAIAEEAHKRGIKTVGFAVPVKDSPCVVEDTWGNTTVMGYYVQNALKRQGTIAQIAENRGFYQPADMEIDMMELMTRYEPRMKMLPVMPGGVSSQDELSIGRQNVLSLLQANPQPGSIAGIVAWWWPYAIGAGQAMQQLGRNEVRIFNHNFSDQLLSAMAAKAFPIEFSTDVPWDELGKKTAEIAVALGRGQDVPPIPYRIKVTAITQDQAAATRENLLDQDKQAIALLGKFGG
jgi:ABC-type sugar transport system substrate-binding protein